MLALALLLVSAQPRLGVVDTTPAGAPRLLAAVSAAAGKLGRFDVQPADVSDAAVAEARRVGAACGFDDGPDCWARLGVLSDLDRILVMRKTDDRLDLLLVDVPARTEARSSTHVDAGADPAKLADDALAALLTGAPQKAVAKPAGHGPLFVGGVYAASFGAVLVAGCGGGALGVSSQMANLLVQARDQKVPLDDKYRGLDAAFLGLTACTGVAVAAGVTGGVLALVSE